MNKLFSSVFNYEVLVNALIGTIGYGFGFSIAYYFHLNIIICILISMIFGSIFDVIGEKVSINKIIRRSKKIKTYMFIIIYGIYFMCSLLIHTITGYDIDNDLLAEIGLTLLFQLITLIIQSIKRKYKYLIKR